MRATILSLLLLTAALPARAQEKKEDPTSKWPKQAKELQPCISQLTDEDPEVRKKAVAKLLAGGVPAMYPIREALYSRDGDVRRRAEILIQLIVPRCPEDLRDRLSSMAVVDPSLTVKDRKGIVRDLAKEQPYWVVPVLEALAVLEKEPAIRKEIRGILTGFDKRWPLEVELSAPSTTIRPGEEPEITITLKNTGRGPIDILKPVDGSFGPGPSRSKFQWELHRRVPGYESLKVRPRRIAGCGSLDWIHLRSLETLKPRGSFSFKSKMDIPDPGWKSYLLDVNMVFKFDQPGEYELTIIHWYDARMERGQFQRVDADAKPRLCRIPGFFKRSKPLRITVASQ